MASVITYNTSLYFHINNTTGKVFYVGIGNEKRAYSKYSRNKWWKHIVNKYDYDVIIEETNLSWEEACELERYWINRIGRRDLNTGTLVNLTDGGDGSKNRKHSNETKNKMSITRKGKVFSDDHKLAMSLSQKDKPRGKMSEEQKNAISNGIKSSNKIRKPFSDKALENMKLAAANKPKMTDATKLKLSLATKAYWDNKKKNTTNI